MTPVDMSKLSVEVILTHCNTYVVTSAKTRFSSWSRRKLVIELVEFQISCGGNTIAL